MVRFCFLLGIAIVLLSSCKEECPCSFLIEQDPIPRTVDNRIRYRDINSLTFVSDNHDTVKFFKYYDEIDNVVSERIWTVTCDADPTQEVDILYEKVINKMFYASEDFDTLRFEFFPKRIGFIDFNCDYYERVYGADVFREPPRYYHMTILKIRNTETRHFLTGDSAIHNDYDLLGTYEVDDIQIEDTYFWTQNDSTYLYFTVTEGLVGFTDNDLVDWIRIL